MRHRRVVDGHGRLGRESVQIRRLDVSEDARGRLVLLDDDHHVVEGAWIAGEGRV